MSESRHATVPPSTGGPSFCRIENKSVLLPPARPGCRLAPRSHNIQRMFESIGRYFLLMQKVFSRPERCGYTAAAYSEMEALGLNSR